MKVLCFVQTVSRKLLLALLSFLSGILYSMKGSEAFKKHSKVSGCQVYQKEAPECAMLKGN